MKMLDKEYRQVLEKEKLVEAKGTAYEFFGDDVIASMISSGVRTLVDEMDDLVKDLTHEAEQVIQFSKPSEHAEAMAWINNSHKSFVKFISEIQKGTDFKFKVK